MSHPGRQYDPEGNVNQWWSDSSISEYKNRQECFVTQYSMYEKFGRSVSLLYQPNIYIAL